MPNLNHTCRRGGEWFREDRSPVFQTLVSDVKKIITYPLSLHHKGYEEVERFMKERIDENGTLYSYATASFYMIYALLALGHSIQSPIIQKAITGITSYIWKMEREPFAKLSINCMGYSFTQLCFARSSSSKASKVIHNASAYLLRKQQTKKVDWSVHAPDLFPGGWGFSDVNTTIPDIDDTTAALRALARSRGNENVDTAWKRAVNWVKGLQNNDGGWGLLKKG